MPRAAGQHREIAVRYAWDDRQRSVRGKRNGLLVIRLRELERWFRHVYGTTLPDDDAGRDDLFIAAQTIAAAFNEADRHIPAWASLWAPWATKAHCEALISQVKATPYKWTADSLAWRLGIRMGDRMRLEITTIGAIDCAKAERAKRRAERKKAAKSARRRSAGVIERAKYEAGSVSRERPWERLGISRATWFRRGKPEAPPRGEETPLTVRQVRPPADLPASMLGPDLSHHLAEVRKTMRDLRDPTSLREKLVLRMEQQAQRRSERPAGLVHAFHGIEILRPRRIANG